jgi:hypothetical protein
LAETGIQGLFARRFWSNIAWPFEASQASLVVLQPFQYFGIVGGVFTALLLAGSARLADRSVAIGCGLASGILGSLWWWISWKRWWFALLHGAIWGACVGYALWRAHRQAAVSGMTGAGPANSG